MLFFILCTEKLRQKVSDKIHQQIINHLEKPDANAPGRINLLTDEKYSVLQ